MALCVRLYNEPVHVQPRTRSVRGCRKATEVRQLHTCTTYHPASFNFLVCPSLSCNLSCVSFSIRMIVLAVCCAILDIFSSCMLIFCFISMVTVIYKQTRSSAILAKQLRFNHRGLTFNTHDKSAVVMLAVVVAFALASFATYLRCDFLQLLGKHKTQDFSCKSDFKFRIPMLVLNSAINPLAYAFFKRDIKRALKGK